MCPRRQGIGYRVQIALRMRLSSSFAIKRRRQCEKQADKRNEKRKQIDAKDAKLSSRTNLRRRTVHPFSGFVETSHFRLQPPKRGHNGVHSSCLSLFSPHFASLCTRPTFRHATDTVAASEARGPRTHRARSCHRSAAPLLLSAPACGCRGGTSASRRAARDDDHRFGVSDQQQHSHS